MSGSGGSWKVAYADFVTAMMAFFLLMWILNMVPPEKLVEIQGYFQAPGGYNTQSTKSMTMPPMVAPSVTPTMPLSGGEASAIAKALKDIMEPEGLPSEEANISVNEMGVLLRVTGNVMFEQNGVDLSEGGQKILDRVIKVMQDFKVYLVVRGHTSSMETGAPRFVSKWELSAARSAAAVSYIIEKGNIPPTMIMAVSYADTRPVLPDSVGEDTPQNRRVEFYFHKPEAMRGIMGY